MAFGLFSCGEESLTKSKYREVVIEPSVDTSFNPRDLKLPPGHPPVMNTKSSMTSPDPQTQVQIEASIVNVPLKWEIPEGWQEIKSSGLRLVTFQSPKENPIECSIVSLEGMAGGLESNVHRWMGQINLTISDQEFTEFLQGQEKIISQGDLPISFIDFTLLQMKDQENVPSMIAGILNIQEKTIFIKMTGSKSSVTHHKEKFKQLCRSLQIKNE